MSVTMDNSMVSYFRHCHSVVPVLYEENWFCSANNWQHGTNCTL